MSEAPGQSGNAAEQEVQMREHEREARARAGEEGSPEQRRDDGGDDDADTAPPANAGRGGPLS